MKMLKGESSNINAIVNSSADCLVNFKDFFSEVIL